MTKDEFLKHYAKFRGDTFLQDHDAVPCNCNFAGCFGWKLRTKTEMEWDKNALAQKKIQNK